ncbi:MAG: hypothetical protein QOI62_3113 [Solirubrobacteraceae bacterium]|jgi:hypothetical protein|nr:hypothetical protein [Solirubrobacteraceae bacterium]
MRRSRYVPADPVRSTGETWEAICELVDGGLASVDAAEIESAFDAARRVGSYLVRSETLAEDPLTIVAGSAAWDIYTLHGEKAIGAEEPATPPGAGSEAEWTMYLPAPSGAPFDAAEISGLHARIETGPAPAGAGVAKAAESARLADLVDLDALRQIGGRS